MNVISPRRDSSGLMVFALVLTLQTVWLGSSAHAQQAQQNLPPPKPVPGQTVPIPPKVKEITVPGPVPLQPPTTRPSDVPNRPLTANEAVRIALRNQPTVAEARASIAAAQGRTQQIRSGLLPSLDITAGYTHTETLSTEGGSRSGASGGTGNGTNNGTGGTGGTITTGSGSSSSGTGLNATANLRQLIFDFNHTRDLVRQASLQERATVDNLARVQSDLVLTLKQAFYLYIQNSQLVAINADNVANRQSQLALARARLNSGLGLPSDVVTAETALDEAATNLVTARTNETLARINLALVMGIDPRTPIDAAPSTEPPVVGNDLQGLVGTALRQRPDILQAVNLVSAAKYGVNAARTGNAPSIAGNLFAQSRGENIPPGTESVGIGISVQWDPFDGGLTAGRVKEARANVDIAQAQLAGTQLTVVSDVSQAFINLRNAEQRLVTTDTEVVNATEGVRIAEGRFSRGIGLFLDIINAQAALVTARTNRASAQFGVDQARAALARAVGAPLPR